MEQKCRTVQYVLVISIKYIDMEMFKVQILKPAQLLSCVLHQLSIVWNESQ